MLSLPLLHMPYLQDLFAELNKVHAFVPHLSGLKRARHHCHIRRKVTATNTSATPEVGIYAGQTQVREGDAEADFVVISPTTDQHLTPILAVVPIFQGVEQHNAPYVTSSDRF